MVFVDAAAATIGSGTRQDPFRSLYDAIGTAPEKEATTSRAGTPSLRMVRIIRLLPSIWWCGKL